MCHQSVGLIARVLEGAGVVTTSLTSALSITRAANPPRAAFVDYPLGHTSGKPFDRDDQLSIVRGALDLLVSAVEPGAIADLRRVWSDDDSWKQRPLSGGSRGLRDGRAPRSPSPVYQSDEDRELAILSHGPGGSCASCIGTELPE